MPSRQYDVEAEPVLGPEGFYPGGPPLDIPNDRTALDNFMLDMSAVLQQVGGTLSVVALRQEIAPELFVPVGFRAKWDTYAPAQRLPREQAKAAPEPPQPPPPAEPEPQPEQPQVAEPQEDFLADDEEGDDFGPDAEEALRERAVAAAAE